MVSTAELISKGLPFFGSIVLYHFGEGIGPFKILIPNDLLIGAFTACTLCSRSGNPSAVLLVSTIACSVLFIQRRSLCSLFVKTIIHSTTHV